MDPVEAFPDAITVGTSETYLLGTGADRLPGPYHVSVTATFTDGTSQVILDTNVGASQRPKVAESFFSFFTVPFTERTGFQGTPKPTTS